MVSILAIGLLDLDVLLGDVLVDFGGVELADDSPFLTLVPSGTRLMILIWLALISQMPSTVTQLSRLPRSVTVIRKRGLAHFGEQRPVGARRAGPGGARTEVAERRRAAPCRRPARAARLASPDRLRRRAGRGEGTGSRPGGAAGRATPGRSAPRPRRSRLGVGESGWSSSGSVAASGGWLGFPPGSTSM